MIEIDLENSIIEEDLIDIDDEKEIETDEDTKDEDSIRPSLYPFNFTKKEIEVAEAHFSIFEFNRQIGKKIILNPEFQRNLVWKKTQMSFFIESILLNFPLPPFYFNETIDGKSIVIDGRQRTTTIQKFLNNELILNNLQAIPEINGKRFSELTESQKSKIEERQLSIWIIKPSVPLEVVYDIFYRINTGGEQLQRQEIRNCIYIGKSTQLLKELSEMDYFRNAIDNGISSKRMKDREAILRYLSFRIQGYKNYNSEMSDYLENTMKMINLMDEIDLEILKKDFQRVMEWTYIYFEETNFRFPTDKSRGSINIALLESISFFFSTKSNEYLSKYKETIQSNYQILLNNNEYKDAVRTSTSDKKRVLNRFEISEKILTNHTDVSNEIDKFKVTTQPNSAKTQ